MTKKDRAGTTFEYCLQMGAANVAKHAAMSIAAIAVTMACLLLLAAVFLVTVNVKINMSSFQTDNAMLAFIDESYNREAAEHLGLELVKIKSIKNAKFISKDEAFEKYAEQYGVSETKYMTSAIFRDRYAIELMPDATLDEARAALEEVPGIAEVRSDETITNGFRTVQNLVRVVGVSGIVVMVAVAFLIIINTIKLTMVNRKEEYAVMQMMGARNWFLKLPLVSEGAIVGGFAALAAFGLSCALYILIKRIMSSSGILALISVVPTREIAIPLLSVTMLIGLGIGISGSMLAIRKFL